MVPRVETHVLDCAEGGHACLGNPLPWLLQGPFLGTKATLQISISGVCYSLWVGSADGFPCLYEGLLAEMEEAWECTDIDFFIPVHTLMYWLLCRSVRNMLFATGWGSWEGVNKILSHSTTKSKAISLSFHCNKCSPEFVIVSGKHFTFIIFVR